MSKYIDIVVCRHDGNTKPFVFQAPAWSYLDKGDRVVVETKKGETEATVERSYTVEKDGTELDFFLIASGASVPLRKVLKTVKYIELKYEEEEENE